MRVRTWGAGKVRVVTVLVCASMIAERAQVKAQSTSRTVAARMDAPRLMPVRRNG